MDRRGRALLALLALAAAQSVLAAGEPPLRALGWLSSEGAVEALTTEPARRLDLAASPAERTPLTLERRRSLAAAGEALFHNPLLLGGQAAKAGISCASCHVNGRGNPHFLFPGVSGAPGTADVTHSFFSSRRGDGAVNPVAIPDLAEPGKVSRTAPGELEAFVRGLIVEEFDGAEPGDAALAALATYVRALRPAREPGSEPVTVSTHLRRAEQALAAAARFSDEPGGERMAALLLGGARQQLGLVHERLVGARGAQARKGLREVSADIADMRRAVRQDSRDIAGDYRRVHRRLDALRPVLAAAQHGSHYDAARLRRAVEGSDGP